MLLGEAGFRHRALFGALLFGGWIARKSGRLLVSARAQTLDLYIDDLWQLPSPELRIKLREPAAGNGRAMPPRSHVALPVVAYRRCRFNCYYARRRRTTSNILCLEPGGDLSAIIKKLQPSEIRCCGNELWQPEVAHRKAPSAKRVESLFTGA